MSKVTIWHNPRCSKSRATMAILTAAGIIPEIVEYKKTPPSTDDIRSTLDLLGIKASGLIRKGEAAYKALDLANANEDQLIAAMSAHPELIERPVVFANGKAAIGRPPEAVKEIL